MTPPKPDRHSAHILWLAGRVVSLPFVFALATYRWLKGVLSRDRSRKDLRAEHQARQSQVGRELRGLPPDHEHPPAAKP